MMTKITIDNFHVKDNGERYVGVDIRGTYKDLLNLLACAMDAIKVRDLFYRAVELDKKHDRAIGRRINVNFGVELDNEDN